MFLKYLFSQNFWKGSECQRGAGLDDRSSKCYDCCDGEATASCNANFATAYKAAADVEDVEGAEFENSWKLKTGKYWENLLNNESQKVSRWKLTIDKIIKNNHKKAANSVHCNIPWKFS